MQDEMLIALFTSRSEDAVSQTANTYGGLCRSIASGILIDERDVEECVNDAYLALWNAIPPAQPRNLRAYLGKIVRNTALNRYDRDNAKKRNSRFDAVLDELGELADSGESVQREFDAKHTGELISRYLRTVSEQQRGVFIRRYWYCEPVKEIAQRYGISESKTASMLLRMRMELRQRLIKEDINI